MKYVTIRISESMLNKINQYIQELNSEIEEFESYSEEGPYRIVSNKKATLGSVISFIIKTSDNNIPIIRNNENTKTPRIILSDESYKILKSKKNQKVYIDSIINNYFRQIIKR